MLIHQFPAVPVLCLLSLEPFGRRPTRGHLTPHRANVQSAQGSRHDSCGAACYVLLVPTQTQAAERPDLPDVFFRGRSAKLDLWVQDSSFPGPFGQGVCCCLGPRSMRTSAGERSAFPPVSSRMQLNRRRKPSKQHQRNPNQGQATKRDGETEEKLLAAERARKSGNPEEARCRGCIEELGLVLFPDLNCFDICCISPAGFKGNLSPLGACILFPRDLSKWKHGHFRDETGNVFSG